MSTDRVRRYPTDTPIEVITGETDPLSPHLVNPSVADNLVSFSNTTGGQKDSGKKASDFYLSSNPSGYLASISGLNISSLTNDSGYYKSGDTATFANVTDNGLTASQALMTDADKKLISVDYLNQAVKTTSDVIHNSITCGNLTVSGSSIVHTASVAADLTIKNTDVSKSVLINVMSPISVDFTIANFSGLYASVALGLTASATGVGAIAIGGASNASNVNSGSYNIAIGQSTTSSGSFPSVCIGNSNTASGAQSISIGAKAEKTSCVVSGVVGVGIGYSHVVTGDGGLAIGHSCTCSATYGLAIGRSVAATTNSTAMAIGYSITNTTGSSLALGISAIQMLISSGLVNCQSSIVRTTGDFQLLSDSNKLEIGNVSGGDLQLYHNGTDSIIENATGKLYLWDGASGINVGGSTTQLVGFYGVTPIAQPTATLDLGVVLSNLGLRAVGTAYPITTSGDFTHSGDLFWTGDGSGIPYGEMGGDNISHVVDIVSADAYVEIDGDLTGGELNLVTFPDDHYLLITKAGRYLINWSISAQTASVANKEVEGGVMLNGTIQTKGRAHAEVSPGGSNRPETIAGTLILDLAINDQISLGVENHTDATDVVIHHANLTLIMVGGT